MFRRLPIRIHSTLKVIYLTVLVLARRGNVVKRSAIHQKRVVVSLTTHGSRLKTSYITLASILRGQSVPQKLIVVLSKEDTPRIGYFLRLMARTEYIEVLQAENFRSHLKWLPAKGLGEETEIFVTADDDMIYPQYWLRELIYCSKENPDSIIAYRAKKIVFNSNNIAPYVSWPLVSNSLPSLSNFATGVSGIAYPTSAIRVIRELSPEEALGLAPSSDDVYLHSSMSSAGLVTMQVRDTPLHFPQNPLIMDKGLGLYNLRLGSENDNAIRRCHSAALIKRLTISETGK